MLRLSLIPNEYNTGILARLFRIASTLASHELGRMVQHTDESKQLEGRLGDIWPNWFDGRYNARRLPHTWKQRILYDK